MGLAGRCVRDGEEAQLTQAGLRRNALYTVHGHTDMPGRGTTEINRSVVYIPVRTRGLGQWSDAVQNGPVLAIERVLDDNILGAESHKGFDELIRVPDPKLMQLVHLVECILEGGRDPPADPHVGRGGAMEIIHQTGAVDGLLRPGRPE